MASSICNTVIDCAQPWELARFWSAVLDRPIDGDNEPSDTEVGIPLDGGGELLFIAVPEPKTVKNRVHVCLEPATARDAEIERIVMLGAGLLDDQRRTDGTGWAVLADPEGNEFCVLRSAAERAATS